MQDNLLLNPSKLAVVILGNKNERIHFRNSFGVDINGQQISTTEKAKNLRVIIDSVLRCGDQTSKYIQNQMRD